MSVTTNQEIGNTFEVVKDGPTTETHIIESVVKELEYLKATGAPSESLVGHRLRPGGQEAYTLLEGESLYVRAYGGQGPVTVVLT